VSQSSTSDTRRKSFRVDYVLSLDEAMDAPGVPAIGAEHPLNPFLLVAARDGEPLGRSSYRVDITYDYPRLGSMGPWTRRIRWGIGETSQRWDVDMNGLAIGERTFWNRTFGGPQRDGNGNPIVDDDAKFGVDVPIPDVNFQLLEPEQCSYDVAFDATFWGTVNDAVFFGLPPGFCRYVGAEAEELTAGGWSVTRLFHAGATQVPPAFQEDVGGALIPLEYCLWWRFARTVNGQRVPTQLMKGRVALRANFDLMLSRR
jgi:hypothetical protein